MRIEGQDKNLTGKVLHPPPSTLHSILYLLYDLFLHISIIVLLPYFLFKMAVKGKYRQGLMERFGVIRADKINRLRGERPIWFHAVSVGETKAVVPLVKRLREEHPEIKIVFSTVTDTGNSIAMKNLPWVDVIIFFPLDLSWVVRRVVRNLKPRVFIVVEKEIWPNLLRVLRKEGVPAMVVNGTISSRSFKRYRLFIPFFSVVFEGITLFCVQGREDRERVLSLGIEEERVRVTGNIKFDEGPSTPTTTEMLGLMKTLGLSEGDGVIVAGSTHRGEEEIMLDVFKRLKREFHSLRLIIAPRHPERFDEVERLINEKGISMIRRTALRYEGSELRTENSVSHSPPSYDVILLDTMGELGRVYSLATVAFVGGSLVDVGGHNLLEPAFQRRPILFGPYVGNYTEIARALVSARGGVMVEDGERLWRWSRRFLLEPDTAREYGEAAYGVVKANRGAMEKGLEVIKGLMN